MNTLATATTLIVKPMSVRGGADILTSVTAELLMSWRLHHEGRLNNRPLGETWDRIPATMHARVVPQVVG